MLLLLKKYIIHPFVIDDGSRDQTPSILDRLSSELKGAKVFHKENGGHGSAILFGLEKAKAANLFLMDSDGQFGPMDFWKLWDCRNGADLIIGVRASRHDPKHRLILNSQSLIIQEFV